MKPMASAELLPSPAHEDTPAPNVNGARLKLYAPDIVPVGEKIRMLISDLGNVKNSAQCAIDVSRQQDSVTFEFLTKRDGDDWRITDTQTHTISENDDADTLIDECVRTFSRCMNWDATAL